MKRFGWAIRTGGDPEIREALEDGIRRGTNPTTADAVPLPFQGEARRTHGSEAVRRVAMMRHTPEEWAEMTEDARICYGGRHYTPRWAEALLVGYALICYGVALAFERLCQVTERRGA